MRKLSLLLALLFTGWWWTCLDSAHSQEPGSIIYSRYRHFKIPFQPGAGEQRLKQLQLYVSTDQGRSWQPAANAPPEQRHFRFMTDRDGFFWFSVQTQDLEGRLFPPNMDGAQPSLKVIVDTQPPTIHLNALPNRGNEVGVSWDIRDDNLDLSLPDAVQLEYRRGGGGIWQPLPRNPALSQHYWNPQTNGPVEVRLRARDRAGNWGEAVTTVSLGGGQQGLPQVQDNTPNNVWNGPGPGERRLVNSKRISLNYELKEVGPSGVSVVELWFTTDGRSWNKYPPRPEEPSKNAVIFEVNGEGLYGLTLVAKSGVGLSVRPPQLGDRPQIWVEVDLTRPVVQLQEVIVGEGVDKGKLIIAWSAQDKNLSQQPITLSYGEKADGPWIPINEKMANVGRYVWTMPQRVPYQFYVRVEAADLAGNVGSAVTPQMVRVDLSQPRVNILKIEPAGK
jgi:hypothetical protein